jgi:O-antigen/teichoic acid export membrane protein
LGDIRKLAGQTAIYGLSSIIGRVLGYLLVPLYVRVLTPFDFGTYTELFAYFTFLNILYTYGMETTYFRFASKERNPSAIYNTAFLMLFVSTLLFSVLVVINSHALIRLLALNQDQGFIIICMMLILAFDTWAVIPFARLRQEQRPLKFAWIKIANILINISLNLFFLVFLKNWAEHDPETWTARFASYLYDPQISVGYIFISNLLASFFTLILLSREILLFRLVFVKARIVPMLKYAFPLLIVGFAGMLNDAFDRTILRHLLPYDEVKNKIVLGIYGANVKLAVIMMLIVQAFRFAAEPFFFAKASSSDARQSYALVMKYFIAFGLFVFLGVTMLLDLFKYFIGSEGSLYHEGLDVIPLLLMGNLFLGVYYNLSIWYKIKDKTQIGALISVSGAVLTLIFNIAFIPMIGYYASAIGKVACYAFMVFFSYSLSRKYYPIPYPLKRILFYFMTSLVLYFIHRYTCLFFSFSDLGSIVLGLLFLLLYALIFYVREGVKMRK